MSDESWICHICHRLRPDALIGVFKHDRSADWNLPPGSVMENVRYCLDTPACLEAARRFSFVGAK